VSALVPVVQAFREGRRFLIAGHVDPDPDCIGSLLAVDWLLERLGKEAQPLSHDALLPQWQFFPRIDRIAHPTAGAPWSRETWDTLVVVDCELERTGSVALWADRVERVINIDHHVTNEGTGDINLIDPGAAATGELIYRVIRAAGVGLDASVATLLYAAIMSDTGSFRFSNTTAAAFEIAADLVRHGAEPDVIAGRAVRHALVGVRAPVGARLGDAAKEPRRQRRLDYLDAGDDPRRRRTRRRIGRVHPISSHDRRGGSGPFL